MSKKENLFEGVVIDERMFSRMNEGLKSFLDGMREKERRDFESTLFLSGRVRQIESFFKKGKIEAKEACKALDEILEEITNLGG